MLSKAHLTSHSTMSGSIWVITPLWLSGLWRSFLYSSSVYSCHLFLISSASLRSIPFLSFIEPIFAWKVPLVSPIFLKRSLVFPILLFSSISLHWSLRKLSYLSWVFFGTLHSNGNIFPFLGTMDGGSWHCTGDRDQDHPHGKEMQEGKMIVWGALTNSCEKKRSKKQRRKGMISKLISSKTHLHINI